MVNKLNTLNILKHPFCFWAKVPRMNENELLKIQEWRCSVKKFDSTRKVPASTWSTLEAALVLSPSSFGLQPWKFLVITDAAIRKELTAYSWNQTQVSDCSHFVVFSYLNYMDEAYIQSYIQDIATKRDLPLEKVEGFKKVIMQSILERNKEAYTEWSAKQSYIALGNLMTSAAALGIDTCPMEGLDPKKYNEILGLAGTSYSTVMACAVGYRHPEDPYTKLKKIRFSPEKIVKHI